MMISSETTFNEKSGFRKKSPTENVSGGLKKDLRYLAIVDLNGTIYSANRPFLKMINVADDISEEIRITKYIPDLKPSEIIFPSKYNIEDEIRTSGLYGVKNTAGRSSTVFMNVYPITINAKKMFLIEADTYESDSI